MTSSPFSARGIDLSCARLVPLDPACCPSLAEAIVAIPPWSVMPYPADAMARFLAASADGAYRYLVEAGGKPAGAVSIRHPWLKGPYLELLALLPPLIRLLFLRAVDHISPAMAAANGQSHDARAASRARRVQHPR